MGTMDGCRKGVTGAGCEIIRKLGAGMEGEGIGAGGVVVAI